MWFFSPLRVRGKAILGFLTQGSVQDRVSWQTVFWVFFVSTSRESGKNLVDGL